MRGPSKSELGVGLETSLQASGWRLVAGVDEVGRGCLAGPVFAAAVIFPPNLVLPGVRDSKELRPAVRERLYQEIVNCAEAWAIDYLPEAEIDRLNIHRASLEVMGRAVARLNPSPDFVLVDGRCPIPGELQQRALVGGDKICQSIAAASILAKVTRDRWMVQASRHYPEYAFERHKGYGTALHRAALRRYGPSPIHRRSFNLGF